MKCNIHCTNTQLTVQIHNCDSPPPRAGPSVFLWSLGVFLCALQVRGRCLTLKTHWSRSRIAAQRSCFYFGAHVIQSVRIYRARSSDCFASPLFRARANVSSQAGNHIQEDHSAAGYFTKSKNISKYERVTHTQTNPHTHRHTDTPTHTIRHTHTETHITHTQTHTQTHTHSHI